MNVILAHESRVVRGFLRAGLDPTPWAAALVTEAEGGAELLRRLHTLGRGGALVILDWSLPGLDVQLLLSHLSGNGSLSRVSILLCVNAPQVPHAEQAVRRGARGFLVRPFTNEALAAKIDELPPPRPAELASGAFEEIATAVQVHEELPSIFGLPSAVLSRIFDGAVRSRHEPGSVILQAGEPLAALPFVTSGDVEIEATEGPADRTVRGAGECFGERAFVCGEPARIRVRALTVVTVASVAKESVVELARHHPALQDFLTKILYHSPTRKAAEGDVELAGTTASLPFTDLLQFLHASRKTGVLVLESDGGSGRIILERGEVRDARTADDAGEAAFARLAALSEARFEFRPGAAPAARTVTRSTMQLLMGCFLPSSEPVAARVG